MNDIDNTTCKMCKTCIKIMAKVEKRTEQKIKKLEDEIKELKK